MEKYVTFTPKMHTVKDFEKFAYERMLEIVEWDDSARWKKTAK
jgi:hypothetical protein